MPEYNFVTNDSPNLPGYKPTDITNAINAEQAKQAKAFFTSMRYRPQRSMPDGAGPNPLNEICLHCGKMKGEHFTNKYPNPKCSRTGIMFFAGSDEYGKEEKE